MPSSTYRPLEIVSDGDSNSEYTRFRNAAREGTPLEELVGLTGLDTGLRVSALAHMNDSWFEWRGGDLYIDVPAYQKCTLGSGETGSGGDRTDRGDPCWYCRNRSSDKAFLPTKNRLPDHGDCWHPKSEAGWKGRLIPVIEDETVEILTTYFQLNDTLVGSQSIRNIITRIARRAGIHEVINYSGGKDKNWPTTHDLRDTYGTKLALMGYNRDEIKNAMGHASIEQADDYIQLSGVEATRNFADKWDSDLTS